MMVELSESSIAFLTSFSSVALRPSAFVTSENLPEMPANGCALKIDASWSNGRTWPARRSRDQDFRTSVNCAPNVFSSGT